MRNTYLSLHISFSRSNQTIWSITHIEPAIQKSVRSNGEQICSCNMKKCPRVDMRKSQWFSFSFLSQWFVTIFFSQMSPSISLSNPILLHLNKWDILTFSFKPLLHIEKEPKKKEQVPQEDHHGGWSVWLNQGLWCRSGLSTSLCKQHCWCIKCCVGSLGLMLNSIQ